MEDKIKKRPDSLMSNNNNNNSQRGQNKKPEMARYQPPGNRNSDKPPTPPLVNKNRLIKQQQQQQQRQVDIKKVDFKDNINNKNEDIDYTRKTPGSLNEDNNSNNQAIANSATNSQTTTKQETNIKIPINIIKTNNYKAGGGGGGGGILKLDSATLNKMNNSLKKTEQNLETNRNNNQNSYDYTTTSTQQENSNVKMLFDPNNPNKPIYVKEKLANKVSNLYQRTRNESKNRSDEATTTTTNIDLNDSTNIASSLKQVNQDIIKAQNIIEQIKPLEQNLSNLIESIDLNKQTIQEFNLNIMPIRKKLEQLCIDATFTHIETASFANIDLNHWRSCYHHLIETLRKELNNINAQLNQATTTLADQQRLHNLVSIELKNYIQDGNRFYTKFVEKLEEYFLKFKSNDLAALNYVNNCESIRIACHTDMTIKTKNMKLALMCINRCWIAMGDLSRYEELIFATTSATASSLAHNDSIGSSPASSNCSSIDSVAFKSNNNNNIPRDYSVARYHYLKAKALAPKSSRAYHQLAILAVYTKRRLDACYYYFRCLEVNIPLTSVKQALNSIFDEARVKSDAISKFINNAIQNKQQKNAAAQKIDKKSESSSHRIETWYLPSVFTSNQPHSSENKKTIKNIENNNRSSSNNNSSNSDTDDSDNDDDDDDDGDDDDEQENDYDDDDDQNDHKKLSTLELNKRFMHNYLNTIGKLFTKVGMESYYEVCSRMLYEFKELLRRKPCPLQKIRLLQITIINISVIDLLFKMQESQQKKTTTTGFIQRNQLVENAVQLGIDMFVLISKRFTNLLSNYYNKENLLLNEQEADESMKTWRQFFPSIKIFIDWMLCNSKLWQPFPDQLPPDLGPILNRWQIICDMLNLVNKLLNNNSNQNNNDQISSYDIISGKIKLEEDLELVGFVPLLSLPCEFDPKIDKTIDLSHLTENHLMQIRDKKRMEKLCLFADYLCGLEQPYLKYDVVNKCYCPIIISNINNTKQIIINKRCLLSETNNNRTSICSNNSSTSSFKSNEMEYLNNFDSITLNSDPDDNNFEENNNFSQLKEKHRILKEKRNEQEKQNKINVLDHLQRQIELEIRPKFIVPDTNCFVDHLDLINKILTTNYYILVVPLLVINELDKLSKSISNYNDDSLEHAQYVQRSAKKAIQYLNEKFDKRDRNIKAITSQGSVLETIQFRSEELKAKGTNDELILGCCLHFVHDNARDFNKSDRIYLYREIVLLTEDRHLRLKSHTRNVPVKNILHFCRWSHLLLKNENNNNNSGTHHGSYMFNKNKSKQKNGKNNFKQKNKIPNK